MFDDEASNEVIDWLERLSAKEGYAEATQLRRDIISAHETLTWDTLSLSAIESALSTWLDRKRYGGQSLPTLASDASEAAAAEIKVALEAHRTAGNQPATLSVEQFGDAIQALWTALRGPDDPDPEPKANGAAFLTDMNLKR